MLSQTYRMSSKPTDDAAEEKDPTNKLLHRMRVRRLQGEAIRDAILAVSGRLDKDVWTTGGRAPHLFHGRPRSAAFRASGRRGPPHRVSGSTPQFPFPMMLAFDMPQPLSTFGRRTAPMCLRRR